MDYVYAVLLVVVLIGGIVWFNMWSAKKRKAEAWKGTIVKKWTSDQRDSDGDKIGSNYNIQVKLEDGKNKKLDVKQDVWNSLAEGNAVEKRVGDMDPVKV